MFSLSQEKRNLESFFHLFDKIQNFLHTIVFTIQFSVPVVYDGCGGVLLNIRYFTEIMITVIVVMVSVEYLIY